MAEITTVAPVVEQEQASATRVEGRRPRQGDGSRTYANVRSALMSLRANHRSALLAISSVGIGAMLVMALAEIVQGADMLPAKHLYTRAMIILLMSIGVGAFGASGLIVMNILLAQGMERTREFGMRLVIGARRRDIRDQVLFEALFLSLMGGVSGSGWGLIVGFVLTTVFQLPFSVNPVLLILLVSASIVPGIACACYPALKFSHLDVEKVLCVN